MGLLVVYEYGHLATNTFSKYTFTDNYVTNFIIHVVHIIIHLFNNSLYETCKRVMEILIQHLNVLPDSDDIFGTFKKNGTLRF